MNIHSRDEILINTAIKLIKREAIPNLRIDEKPIIFELLKDEVGAGEVLTELDTEDQELFTENVPEDRLEKILNVCYN